MDYSPVVDRIVKNGEPGLAWLDNMRNYGRLTDAPNNKDRRAMGGNPCLEQTLESFEMCCLVETFPNNHESVEDYIKTLRYAFVFCQLYFSFILVICKDCYFRSYSLDRYK